MFASTAIRAFRLRSSEVGDLPSLRDDDGFLDPDLPVVLVAVDARAGDLVATSAVCDVRSLVVLGEPGQGKTFALHQIESELQARGLTVVWIVGSDLNDSAFDLELTPATSNLLGEPPDETATSLAIVIDGLDESPMVSRLGRRLARALAHVDPSRYRLILGCRTADVPSELASSLSSLTAEPTWVCDLAPLTRAQATSLVDGEGLSGATLVADAVGRGAGVLASVPLTLRLLVDVYQRGGSLPETARELFELGATRLLDATGREGSTLMSTADERRAIAERIAAVLTLCGKRTIHVGPALDAHDQDLRIGEVTDGTERTAGGEFTVTQNLVRETLATAMFSSRGPHRCAFVHSSHAALLAASYLANREPQVPKAQLEGLLLVSAPDGAKTVPTPQREVAAWLAVLDERVGAWLAATDPTSLIGHESYIDSVNLRESVVGRLFDVAAEFELAERYWRDINLDYPGLAARLVGVLAPFVVQPTDWNDFARCRLALRLSAYVESDAVATQLLNIACSPDWNTHLGSLAVEALLRQGDRFTEPLAELLAELQDPEFSRLRDPDDELRGHLLAGLWPHFIQTSAVLPLLTPRRSDLIGSYWLFLRQFAERIRPNDLPEVLVWAAARASDQRTHPYENEEERRQLGDLPIGMLDADLADGLLHRALTSENVIDHLAHAAEIAWPRLSRFDRAELPAAVTDDVRRGLAEALLRMCAGSEHIRADVWHIIREWKWATDGDDAAKRFGLLDSGDFVWAVERTKSLTNEQPAIVEAFVELTQMLFNAADRAAADLALAQEGTVLWPAFRHWFDAVKIDSETADRMREQYRHQTQANTDVENSEAAALVRERLLAGYEAMRDDPTKFWEVVDWLQYNPKTGYGRRLLSDRLLDFPAMGLLPHDAPEQLAVAAAQFIEREHDRGDEWLGTPKYDKRGWAGYLALVLLAERGQLASLDESVLANWSAAILWFHSVPHDTGNGDLKRALLTLTTLAHPQVMRRRLVQYVRGELRRGSSIWEIEAFDDASIRLLLDTWIELTTEVTTAVLAVPIETPSPGDPTNPIAAFPTVERIAAVQHDWELLLKGLTRAAPDEATRLVVQLLETVGSEAEALAARGVKVLLTEQPAMWPTLEPKVRTGESLGRQVALAIAGRDGFMSTLSEDELGELYTWLSTLFAPEADPPFQSGVSFASPDSEARRWRDDVLAVLSNRANQQAIHQLTELRHRYPERTVILYQLLRARSSAFATGWSPPTPGEIQRLFEDYRRRLVRSADELGSLVEQTLNEIADGFGHTGQLLWDRQPTPRGEPERWRPKPEAALSAFLAHDLQLRLQDRGVAAHREVVVKQTDAYGAGDRVDIHVEVRARPRPGSAADAHRVVIEVKGCWNQSLLTAQVDQLTNRYLPEADANVGVYVVGWFPKHLWDDTDPNHTRGPATAHDLIDTLEEQAREIAKGGVAVTPIVLTIPRPSRDR